MLVAIYARHSTDKQQGSTEDQIARCRQHCDHLGYRVAGIYRDDGVSGAALTNRPGIKRLLKAAMAGSFVRVVTEDLSRLSRDQGDIATLYKKLSFIGVFLETVAEGTIGELHIGLKGTMNALYLKDLADKTRRGQIAAVLKGAIPGGQTYGYDIVRRLDENGEPLRGARAINEHQAGIVRQIFARYVTGDTLNRICADLNALGEPSPTGGKWAPSTLVGTASRGTGILRQTMYKGMVTFNKMHFRKHPETGKRLSVPRPSHEWVQVPAPELAIVDEELFDRVQDMIVERSSARREAIEMRAVEDAAARAEREAERQRVWRRQQATTRQRVVAVFSGRLYCADHGHRIVTQRRHRYTCPEPDCRQRNISYDELIELCIEEMAALATEDIDTYFASPEVAAERAEHERTMADLTSQIEARRDKVRQILLFLGPQDRTESIREVLAEQEVEIRRLRLALMKEERRRDALQPSPAAVSKALSEYRRHLAHLRLAPEDHRYTIPLRECVDRFVVGSVAYANKYGWRRIVTADFNVPKIMALSKE